MGQIENTAIMREVQYVMSGPSTEDLYAYDAFLHLNPHQTKERNASAGKLKRKAIKAGEDITVKALNVLSMDINRDYVKNFADELTIEVALPVGSYADLVYPAKDDLEVTLMKKPLFYRRGVPPKFTRYKAVMVDTGRPRVSSTDGNTALRELLDVSDVVVVTIQLVPISNYVLRTAQVGVIFRQETVESALLTLLSDQIKLIKSDHKDVISGVDLVKPDNDEVKEQIVIPHGTPLISVPDYVQNKSCGVYNSGISSYVQEGTWYIYPTHNLARASQHGRSCTVVLLPRNKYPGLDRTSRRQGEHVVILATTEAVAINVDKALQMNQGSGVRFTNAETILDKDTIRRQDNKVVTQRGMSNTEVTANTQADKLEYTPIAKEGITSNPFKHYSSLASLKGGLIGIHWEHSSPDLIFPGMMCEIVTTGEDGRIMKGKGVIHTAIHQSRLVRPGIVDKQFITTSILKIRFDDSGFH